MATLEILKFIDISKSNDMRFKDFIPLLTAFVVFFLTLSFNLIGNKLKAKKRFKQLKNHTEIWLRKIIENGRDQTNSYRKYSDQLLNFKDGILMLKKSHIINCKQILTIDKEDLENLFISKIKYLKTQGEDKLIDQTDESENYTLLIENLEGIENNLKMTNGEYDFIENLIQVHHEEFISKRDEISDIILEHEVLEKKLLVGNDEYDYFQSMLKVQQDALDGQASKIMTKEEQIEKIFIPIRDISQEYYNNHSQSRSAKILIYKCNQLIMILERNAEMINRYGLAFKDYAIQLEDKTNYNEVFYKRYLNSKVKSWIHF